MDCQHVEVDALPHLENSREHTSETWGTSTGSVPSPRHPSQSSNRLTYNAPMSGAGVRSTEASAPLAGYMAAGVISLDCCFGLACSLTGCEQNS